MEEESTCIANIEQIKSTLQQCNVKISHKKWKALLKKEKRKIKRQDEARKRQEEIDEEERKKENSPTFQAKQKELEEIENLKEQREEAERVYLNKLWQEKERLAQEEFQIQKEREAMEKERKLEIEKKIKEEWEERQRKEKEEEDIKEKKKEKQPESCGEGPVLANKVEELLKEATANENKDEPWHNPIATLLPGTERETCMFFSKTGACRFGERCSRGHPYPEISNTLMFSNMYNHFELEQGLKDDLDTTDVALEYDDGELYQNFQDFYNDIVPEFRTYGKVIQVKVCNNYEPHLRGNVYVQYKRESSAQEAFMGLNGRFYGGKQISGQFVEIRKWKSAICGLFRSGRCPKGRNCNFLHVFKNPNNEFWNADIDNPYESNESVRSRRQRSRSPRRSHRSSSRRDRRSPESQRFYYDRYSTRHSRSRSRSRERSYVRSRKKNKYSRSRSRSHERSRSRSRRVPQSRSRSSSRERVNSRKTRKHSNDSRSRSRSQSRSKKSRKREKRSRSKTKLNSDKQYEATTGSEQNSIKDNATNGTSNFENEQLSVDPVNESNGSVSCEEKNPDFLANGNNTESVASIKSDSTKQSVKKHKKHKKHKHKKKTNTISDSE